MKPSQPGNESALLAVSDWPEALNLKLTAQAATFSHLLAEPGSTTRDLKEKLNLLSLRHVSGKTSRQRNGGNVAFDNEGTYDTAKQLSILRRYLKGSVDLANCVYIGTVIATPLIRHYEMDVRCEKTPVYRTDTLAPESFTPASKRLH